MDLLATLLDRWRDDPAGSYHRWFLWEERLKNFRSIRRGLALVADVYRIAIVAAMAHTHTAPPVTEGEAPK